MPQNERKQEEQTKEKKVPIVPDDSDIYFFNPWDEQFKRKPQGQEFEF